MKSRIFYVLIILISFIYGVIVGHYKIFPYNLLFTSKTFYNKTKAKILNTNKFSEYKKCINDTHNDFTSTNEQKYSFFIAGHVYGDPKGNNLGIYPKFYKELLKSQDSFKFGILAGDITRDGTNDSWDYFDEQIKKINTKLYIAPGNHDVGITNDSIKNLNFKKRYGKLYQSFKYNNDLFIILNPYENMWSIKDNQLEFLNNELKYNHKYVDNIFIITHPAIYVSKKFNVKINGFNGAGDNINFWSEIYPLFKKYKNNYFFVAGDVGADYNNVELFCAKLDNNIFLATGMGGGTRDNYLVFKKIDKKIRIELEVF